MATVVGVAAPEVVVLAGDRRRTNDETVTSESVRRVFDYEFAGVAVVGEAGSIAEFDRRFESELQAYRTARDEPMSIDRLARTASEVAKETGVDALVAGRGEDGAVSLREVGSDGRSLETDVAALGSGAPVAFGLLEEGEREDEPDAVETFVRNTLRTVAKRVSDTGTDIDVFRLEGETR